MVKRIEIFEEELAVTSVSDAFVVSPNSGVSVAGKVATSGACVLEYTLDDESAMVADTAVWVEASSSPYVANFGEQASGPMQGVRLVVSSGSWDFKILQSN